MAATAETLTTPGWEGSDYYKFSAVYQGKVGMKMEQFYNGDDFCIVLQREGDTALICMPGNRATPYVVPMIHNTGAPCWLQGRYFGDLKSAVRKYDETMRLKAEHSG
jgi:hypothetical protein